MLKVYTINKKDHLFYNIYIYITMCKNKEMSRQKNIVWKVANWDVLMGGLFWGFMSGCYFLQTSEVENIYIWVIWLMIAVHAAWNFKFIYILKNILSIIYIYIYSKRTVVVFEVICLLWGYSKTWLDIKFCSTPSFLESTSDGPNGCFSYCCISLFIYFLK